MCFYILIFSYALTDLCVCVSDMLLEDSIDGGSRKEGHHVKVVVSLDSDPEPKEV